MRAKDRNLQKAWARGKPAEIKRVRPPSSVLSIRVPSELLEDLSRRQAKRASLQARTRGS